MLLLERVFFREKRPAAADITVVSMQKKSVYVFGFSGCWKIELCEGLDKQAFAALLAKAIPTAAAVILALTRGHARARKSPTRDFCSSAIADPTIIKRLQKSSFQSDFQKDDSTRPCEKAKGHGGLSAKSGAKQQALLLVSTDRQHRRWQATLEDGLRRPQLLEDRCGLNLVKYDNAEGRREKRHFFRELDLFILYCCRQKEKKRGNAVV